MEVQFAKFFIKERLCFLNHKIVAISLATQSIGHYISLARGI
jgi:hypothetical protein